MIQEISFKGGLNLEADFMSIPPGQCMQFYDMQLDYGMVNGRDPFKAVSTGSVGSDFFYSFFIWQDSNGPFLYAASGHSGGTGKMYRSSVFWQTAQLTTPVSYSDVSGGQSYGTSGVTHDVLNGLLLVADLAGGGNIIKFTSNTANGAALGAGPSNVTCLKVVNNYLFAATLLSSTFQWSNASDPTTWPGGNSLSFNTSDGDYITAIAAIGTDAIIFKRNSIAKLSTVSNGTTLGPLNTIFKGLGTFGQESVCQLKDGTLAFWASDGNIYITDGYTFNPIARLPTPQPSIYGSALKSDSFTAGNINNRLQYYPVRDELWVSSTNVGNTPAIFIYDFRQKYWRGITVNGVGGTVTPMSIGVGIVSSAVSGSTYPAFMFGAVNAVNTILCLADYINNTGHILDASAANVTGVVETSTFLPQNLAGSQVYGVSAFTGVGSNGGTLSIGYDTTYSSNTFTVAGGSKYRLDVNNLAFGTSTNLRPATMQIKFQSSFCLANFSKVYVYDTLGN